MFIAKIINLFLALSLAPLLFGIINRTKAIFAGRTGQPLLQTYYDISKLLHKGAVYSQTTSWIFRAGPIIGLSVTLVGTLLVPLGGYPAIMAFEGDFILFVYLFGLMRFFTVLSAMDTGSSFEGMGASREVTFSAFAEPAFLIGLAVIAKQTGSISLSHMLAGINVKFWDYAGAIQVMIAFAFFIVFLSENARIPVDDPNTHLELTMIHEVMVLDHGGVDFGFIIYSTTLKMWLLGTIIVETLVPVHSGNILIDMPASVMEMLVLAVLVGIVESSMARLKLLHVPQLLIGATTISILALILVLR
jgi:formate hydrogenlyase subunit 4